jgi:hypothetical protein
LLPIHLPFFFEASILSRMHDRYRPVTNLQCCSQSPLLGNGRRACSAVIEDNELKGMVSIGDLVKHRLDEKELEASVLRDIQRMRA